MEFFAIIKSNYQTNSFQSISLSERFKTSCFPFSVSRMKHRVANHLFGRNKRRSSKTNKQSGLLTNNMDSYQYTPSDNELQQLLYI